MSAEYSPGAANDLSDYVRVLRRRWKLIAAIAGGCLLLAVLYSFSQADKYAATAKVQIPTPVNAGTGGATQNAADVATEVAVMKSQAVAQRVKELLKSPLGADQLLAKVSVTSPPDARVLAVTYADAKALDAQKGAQAFADAYLSEKTAASRLQLEEQAKQLQGTIDGYQAQLDKAQQDLADAGTNQSAISSANSRISTATSLLSQAQARQNELRTTSVDGGSVLQSAELPLKPSGPGLGLLIAVALVLGLGIGIVVAFVRERLDEQVREPSDIEEVLDVPILGSIPRFPERFRSPSSALVTVHAPEGAQADSFRRLRAALLIGIRKNQTQVLAVTSPSSGDGKSTIAANLAVTLAQSGRSVVLISADVRRPSLEELFEIGHGHPGLLDVLGGTATFDEAIVSVGRFPVMASGRLHANPTDLLQSVAMEKLVADARSRFDLVIIDTPPVLAVADVLGLVPMVDDVLLVVSVDQTTEADVANARAELAQAGATVIGAAINRSAETTARYDAYHREPGPF